MTPNRKRRALSAMTHLMEVFGDPLPLSVIMLQKVHSDSLAAPRELRSMPKAPETPLEHPRTRLG